MLLSYSNLMLFNYKIIGLDMNHLESLGLEVKGILGSGSFAQVYECFDPK